MATKTIINRTKPPRLPSVTDVKAAPAGKHLYVWLDDGRSGMVDMSDWTGHPCDKWDSQGFDHWRVDDGIPCWGKNSHISPDLCAEELIEMTYKEWQAISSEPVPARQPTAV